VQKARLSSLFWLPVILWMGTIFLASSDSGSFQHSSRIIAPLLHWVFPNMSEERVQMLVFDARKGAHVTEFAIFAFLVWTAIRKPRWKDVRPWNWWNAIEALWFAVLYAATDEFHQTFVPSREGCLRDVCIDSSGALAGLLVLFVIGRWRKLW